MDRMKPMKLMAPMTPPAQWWPDGMGSPASSGAQNGMRYAVFPEAHRLLVERDGTVTTYDTGTQRIGGVAQAQSGEQTLVFEGQAGAVSLEELRRVD